MMMALLRLHESGQERLRTTSYVDLAGYAACGAEINSKKTEKENNKP